MRLRRPLALAALVLAATAARAEHFEYAVALVGSYTVGGTEGCSEFDPTGCPRPGTLAGMLSFDTPASTDGSWSIEASFGDITNFSSSLGNLSTDDLFGGISVKGGAPNGYVQASDQTETFSFDWATRTASFSYDYGYHSPTGTFAGTLSAVPEPGLAWLILAGLGCVVGMFRRGARNTAST
jgi:hypothetical protein